MNTNTVQQNPKTTKQKIFKVLSITGNVLLWAFLVFSILMTTLVLVSQDRTDLPSVFGRSFVTVQSDSMKDTFCEGDLIVVEMLTEEEKFSLEEGEVITYFVDLNGDGINEINSHRIVSRRERGGQVFYTTKGDNDLTNPTVDDKEVKASEVLGRWIEGKRVGGLGSAVDFLQTPLGFGVVIVIPLIIFFIYELYNFITVLVGMRMKKTSKETEEEIKRRAIEEYIRAQALLQAQQKPEDKPAEEVTPEE